MHGPAITGHRSPGTGLVAELGIPAIATELGGTVSRWNWPVSALYGRHQYEAGPFWQGTVDSLPAHIAVLDEHGNIVAVNAAWRRFAEHEGARSDYMGSNYIAVCEASADPLADVVVKGLRQMLAGASDVFELEYPCHSPSVQRWFALRATRFRGSGPLRVVTAHENVTRHHKSHQLGAAERVARLGTWEWLPVMDSQAWSDNLYRIFGLEPGEITPTRAYVSERTRPDDRERLVKYVDASVLAPRPPPIEFRIRLPAGDVRYLRSTITNIDPGPGGASRIVGMVQDVTDRRMPAASSPRMSRSPRH
jgi:PAS domain-containing protein